MKTNQNNNGTKDFQNLSEQDAWNLRNPGSIDVSPDNKLKVRIKIKAENHFDNAQNPQDFKTKFEVKIKRNGKYVNDANITIQAFQGPTTQLKFVPRENEYIARINHYHRAYQIDIIAGTDRLETIQFAGPAIHYFTAPQPDQTVPGNQDLQLTWTHDGTPADETWLETEVIDDLKIDDNGTYTIPAARLGEDDDDEDEFEIKRLNLMNLPNLTRKSRITIAIENEIEVKLDKHPTTQSPRP